MKIDLSGNIKEEEIMRTKGMFKIFMAAVAMTVLAAAFDGHWTACAADKGIKLPADGGEPGRDYTTYLKALQKRDGATIRKMAEVPPGTSDKELKEQMEMMSAMTPSDQKIVSGSLSGNTATLNVTGILEKKKHYGTIELQRKGGVWKITKEDWSLSPRKK